MGFGFDTGIPAGPGFQPDGARVPGEPVYVPELHPGDLVRHLVFGEGRVMETDGDNVAVNFKTRGVKTLNVTFAPLEKL